MKDKLRVTITFDLEVEDLSHYEATTIEEAARNLKTWYDKGYSVPTEDYECAMGSSIDVGVAAFGPIDDINPHVTVASEVFDDIARHLEE